jgi:pyruvate/2-oxoglutarate dehydrogenase complex dihydrolipoamide dehydrogenase (E3) component
VSIIYLLFARESHADTLQRRVTAYDRSIVATLDLHKPGRVRPCATLRVERNNDTRGFVKIISDPATGVVLGGSIVGRHAAELISVIAVAINAGLTVEDLSETLFVHPTLAEVLAEAAE